jgi:hypothetical protein
MTVQPGQQWELSGQQWELFGLSHWIWRELAQRYVRYHLGRQILPARIWVRDMAYYSLARGRLAFRQRQGAACENAMPTIIVTCACIIASMQNGLAVAIRTKASSAKRIRRNPLNNIPTKLHNHALAK